VGPDVGQGSKGELARTSRFERGCFMVDVAWKMLGDVWKALGPTR